MPSLVNGRSADFLTAAKRVLSDLPRVRSAALWCLSKGCRPEDLGGRITCVMYHGIRTNARKSMAKQLRYLRSLGDLISTTQAIDLLESGGEIDGRYFCITFDDGEYSSFRNGFPLLGENGIPGTFFIIPERIAETPAADDAGRTYMSWEECRQVARHGGLIGSHSSSHRRLSTLTDDEAAHELITSRLTLERELGMTCDQFACPWGQPGRDYRVERDPRLAADAGYRSFFTTIRGSAKAGTSQWAIPRIRLEPEWELHQLRYLLCR